MQKKVMSILVLLTLLLNMVTCVMPVSAADDNLFTGTVPKDPLTGKILFKNDGDNRICYNSPEESTLAYRVSLAAGVGKDWGFREMIESPTGGSFAIMPTQAQYDQELGYIQYDFGKEVSLDQIQLYFANSSTNTSDLNNYNLVPKKYRVDFSANNVDWTKGTERSNDFTKVEDVGQAAVDAYAKAVAGTATDLEKSLLPNNIKSFFDNSIKARFFRFTILTPTQNGVLPGDRKIRIKGLSWYDLSGLADSNKLSDSFVPQYDPYKGNILLTTATSPLTPDNNIRLQGEDGLDVKTLSRMGYSSPGGTPDWYQRHIIGDALGSLYGLKGKWADYMKGNVYLTLDLGKNVTIDRFDIFSEVSSAGYSAFNLIPKNIRIDTGTIDSNNRVVWTTGTNSVVDLSSAASVGADLANKYALIKDLPTSTYATLDSKGTSRTTDEQAIWEAYRSMPTKSVAKLASPANARFYKIVIVDPKQTTFTDTYQFNFRQLRAIDSTKRSLTADWDEATQIKNVYGSGTYGMGGISAFNSDGTNFYNQESPCRAFDSSTSTNWKNGGGFYNNYSSVPALSAKPWVVVDLGAKYNINSFRVNGDNLQAYRIQACTLDGTQTGPDIVNATYSDQATVSDNTQSISTGNCNFTSRYVRFYFDKPNAATGNDIRVLELALYGTPDNGPAKITVQSVSVMNGTTDLVANGLISGTANIQAALTNTKAADESATVIVALYAKGTLPALQDINSITKSVLVNPVNADDNKFNLSLDIPTNPENYVLKVFVWDGFGTLKPADQTYNLTVID